MDSEPLYAPSDEQVHGTRLFAFLERMRERHDPSINGYDALHAFSVRSPELFWREVWDDAGIEASTPPRATLEGDSMEERRFFPGARLNYAEHMLTRRGDEVALVAVDEGGRREPLSRDELRVRVARVQAFLVSRGVHVGDRVAGFLPNREEAVIAMLATTALGAIWSSSSPDFGEKGVMDRFGQIAPKVLFACDGYVYGGKRFSTVARVSDVARRIPSLECVVMVPVLGEDFDSVPEAVPFAEALEGDATEPSFAQVDFDHPLYIMYSSGTTGVPKCIVHGHGGTLLQHAKEHLLHGDLREGDALFYFTTCGWMMWNWLVSGLYAGARLVLYDGSPGHPDMSALFSLAEREGISHFGTSPKFLSSVQKAGVSPRKRFDLGRLRVLLSTGAPLSAALFHWVHDEVKERLLLASISGGTDILSCFMLGSPVSPVYAGEIQKRGLGMAVEAWNDDGEAVIGEKGELVCVKPFPSQPVGFWNDPGGKRYHAAYFADFPGVWRHGDYIEVTEHGGVIVYGRSDATLNPGGVRIGTAEIDRIVEAMDGVLECVVVGQQWQDDVRVILFVHLADGVELDPAFEKALRDAIKKGASPRHVPAKILPCPGVPRTLSGKKVEIAVTRLIHGKTIQNRDALANPEMLDHFASQELKRALSED